jgi:hypothetical protein
MDLDSSSGQTEELIQDGSPSETDVNQGSGSSTETKDQGATSMLDAVQSALKPEENPEKSPTPEPSGSKDASSDPAKAGEKPSEEDLSEDEKKSLKPKVAKRIESLLNDRTSLRRENEGLKTKTADFDKFIGFVKSANLSNDDMNNGFEIMALMKQDPAKAWDKLQPIIATLQGIVGERLPDDLAEKVRLGYINEVDAKQLARAQNQLQFRDGQAQEAQRRAEEEQVQRETQALVGSVSNAASEWERTKAKSDPDWHLKSARVHELMKLSVYENGYPKSADEVSKRLNDAHDQISKELRKLNPRPRAINPVTGTASNPRAVAEPKTMLEAIQQGLQATG